ncbi:MAG: BatA domain-containing protein [Phycisphaerales bacterium]
MSFLNPSLAGVALACVLAPIIIHLLFRRKRRPVEWGAMKFVLEAFRRNRKRLRLEQWLLLAARTLAVLLLALAVGRPMLAGNRPAESLRARDLILVIDNSLTSQANAGSDGALADSRKQASRLLDELNPAKGDRASIITLAGPAEKRVDAPSLDLAGVRRVLDQIEPADSHADFAGAASLIRAARPDNQDREVTVAVLSSLRAGVLDASRESKSEADLAETVGSEDSALSVLASPPAEAPLDNVAIVGVEPLRSIFLRGGAGASSQQARVWLRRFGPGIEKPATVTLRLRASDGRAADDHAWAKSQARFAPGEDAIQLLAPIGIPDAKDAAATAVSWLEARIDEDAIPGDNIYRRAWKMREHIRVAIVAPPSTGDREGGPSSFSAADWLSLALAPTAAARGIDLDAESEAIRTERIDPARLSASDLAAADAVFLTRPDLVDPATWPLLGDFARRGGLVLVCPSPEPGVQKWTDECVKAFGLAWTFDRESIERKPPRNLRGANVDQPLLASLGADLPELIKPVVAVRTLPLQIKNDGDWLLRFDANEPMLVAARPSGSTRGLLVALTVSPELNWTNLPAMPLMVPLVQEIVRQGTGLASGSQDLRAGSPVELPEELRLIEPASARLEGAVARTNGVWRRADARGTTRELVAVNADPAGSNTATQTRSALEPALKNWIKSRQFAWSRLADPTGNGQGLGETGRKPPVDWPLLVAGLCLLLLDVAFSRWFSHATVHDRNEGASREQPGNPEATRGIAA